jgi:hypothetical protein
MKSMPTLDEILGGEDVDLLNLSVDDGWMEEMEALLADSPSSAKLLTALAEEASQMSTSG